jgi:RND superfamily putative drug exporter
VLTPLQVLTTRQSAAATRGTLSRVQGIVDGRTGRLVTSAALILFLAFSSLAATPDTDVKVLATGLGAGILLDATIIRALLLPAPVALFGRWNWWLPNPLARIPRVPRSTAAPHRPATEGGRA